MSQQLGPRQEAWLAALESGEFSQTKNDLECNGSFCCLGVACCVAANEVDINCYNSGEIQGTTLRVNQPDVVEYYQFLNGPLEILMSLNDNDGLSFKRIARRVRSNPGKFFRKAV